VGDYDNLIVDRETERQKFLAQQRTDRIIALCALLAVLVIAAAIVTPIIWSIKTPDPQEVASGTRLDCVVIEE
jgi:hypothetical protein